MADYDLLVIGAGSGNMLPGRGLQGLRVAIVERDQFGGTCLNRGCIPSKMLIHAADVAEAVRTAGRYGIRAELGGPDWPALRDRVFTRVDRDSEDALASRRRSGVDVYEGEARFVAPKVIEVEGQQLRGARIILAAGARPTVPNVPGLADVAYQTTDTIMRVEALPESMVVVGGGFAAVEMSHLFGSLGTRITMVEREPKLLATLDDDVADRFTERASERFDVRLGTKVARVERTRGGATVHLEGGNRPDVVEAETLLICVGRTPNSDVLDVASGGIATDDDGRVIVDEACATNVAGVWAIGDMTNHLQLKHLANAQMRVVVRNIIHPDEPRRAHFPVMPAGVFAEPQIATAGPTERALRDAGRPFAVARRNYADSAFGWAREDTTGFVKLMADPVTRRLLAAHIVGPQAASLIQPLVQAMYLENSIDQLAYDVLYIHPAAPEVVAQALSELARAPA